MKNIKKRSAASRKGWCTRKRMKAAREYASPLTAYADMQHGLIDLLRPKRIIAHIDPAYEKRLWPRWKQNALPNPWLQ
jgi:hypothetical protein